MKLWFVVMSPFALGALIIGIIKACEAWGKWQEKRAMTIRDAQLNRFNMAAFRGSRDRYE